MPLLYYLIKIIIHILADLICWVVKEQIIKSMNGQVNKVLIIKTQRVAWYNF